MMDGRRNRESRVPYIAGALGAVVLVLIGLWLLATRCPWFWVMVNSILQSQAGR